MHYRWACRRRADGPQQCVGPSWPGADADPRAPRPGAKTQSQRPWAETPAEPLPVPTGGWGPAECGAAEARQSRRPKKFPAEPWRATPWRATAYPIVKNFLNDLPTQWLLTLFSCMQPGSTVTVSSSTGVEQSVKLPKGVTPGQKLTMQVTEVTSSSPATTSFPNHSMSLLACWMCMMTRRAA